MLIKYDISSFVYRYFNSTHIFYPLASLCIYQISRILRSSSEKLLKIPKHNIKSAVERSFSVIPLCLSGIRHLPVCRIFPLKAQLKTILFI